MNRKLLVNTLVPIAVWIILLAMPIPQGLAPNAWYYFAMFAAVIVGLVSGTGAGLNNRSFGDLGSGSPPLDRRQTLRLGQVGTVRIFQQHGLADLCGVHVRLGI